MIIGLIALAFYIYAASVAGKWTEAQFGSPMPGVIGVTLVVVLLYFATKRR